MRGKLGSLFKLARFYLFESVVHWEARSLIIHRLLKVTSRRMSARPMTKPHKGYLRSVMIRGLCAAFRRFWAMLRTEHGIDLLTIRHSRESLA
jgi:hypothetical protein